jgi:hypothetical protein
MKLTGDYEPSDVPELLKRFRDSGRHDWRQLLRARAALMDGGQDLVDGAVTAARGLNADERRTFDTIAEQVREINADLKAIKAALVAEHGSEVHVPF